MATFLVYPTAEIANNERRIMGCIVDAESAGAARVVAQAQLDEEGLTGSGPDFSDEDKFAVAELGTDEAILVRGFPLVEGGFTFPGT